MDKIQMTHAETGETLIHYDGPFGEFTLCGDAIEEDRHAASGEALPTNKRATCPRCIAVARHVRGTL